MLFNALLHLNVIITDYTDSHTDCIFLSTTLPENTVFLCILEKNYSSTRSVSVLVTTVIR